MMIKKLLTQILTGNTVENILNVCNCIKIDNPRYASSWLKNHTSLQLPVLRETNEEIEGFSFSTKYVFDLRFGHFFDRPNTQ